MPNQEEGAVVIKQIDQRQQLSYIAVPKHATEWNDKNNKLETNWNCADTYANPLVAIQIKISFECLQRIL